MKRNVTCSWAQIATMDTFYTHTPPQEQETPRRDEIEPSYERSTVVPGRLSLAKTPPLPPESRQVLRLFEIFFARHHEAEFCSFFHKPSLDFPTLNDRSPCLVNSVLSLGALYVRKDEAESDFGFPTPRALSEHYARISKSDAFGLCDEPSGELVLFCDLMYARLISFSRHNPGIFDTCDTRAFDMVKCQSLHVYRNRSQNGPSIESQRRNTSTLHIPPERNPKKDILVLLRCRQTNFLFVQQAVRDFFSVSTNTTSMS